MLLCLRSNLTAGKKLNGDNKSQKTTGTPLQPTSTAGLVVTHGIFAKIMILGHI